MKNKIFTTVLIASILFCIVFLSAEFMGLEPTKFEKAFGIIIILWVSVSLSADIWAPKKY